MIQQIIFEILLGVLVCCIIVDIAIVIIINREIQRLEGKKSGKHAKNKSE